MTILERTTARCALDAAARSAFLLLTVLLHDDKATHFPNHSRIYDHRQRFSTLFITAHLYPNVLFKDTHSSNTSLGCLKEHNHLCPFCTICLAPTPNTNAGSHHWIVGWLSRLSLRKFYTIWSKVVVF